MCIFFVFKISRKVKRQKVDFIEEKKKKKYGIFKSMPKSQRKKSKTEGPNPFSSTLTVR